MKNQKYLTYIPQVRVEYFGIFMPLLDGVTIFRKFFFFLGLSEVRLQFLPG
jgi:hypothetical protein